jgi:hypothetical protein
VRINATGTDRARAHYRKAREGLDELAVGRHGKPPIHPQLRAAKHASGASINVS